MTAGESPTSSVLAVLKWEMLEDVSMILFFLLLLVQIDLSFYYFWYKSTCLSIIPGINRPVLLSFLVQSEQMTAGEFPTSSVQAVLKWVMIEDVSVICASASLKTTC